MFFVALISLIFSTFLAVLLILDSLTTKQPRNLGYWMISAIFAVGIGATVWVSSFAMLASITLSF